jgi:hypothetical protein
MQGNNHGAGNASIIQILYKLLFAHRSILVRLQHDPLSLCLTIFGYCN